MVHHVALTPVVTMMRGSMVHNAALTYTVSTKWGSMVHHTATDPCSKHDEG